MRHTLTQSVCACMMLTSSLVACSPQVQAPAVQPPPEPASDVKVEDRGQINSGITPLNGHARRSGPARFFEGHALEAMTRDSIPAKGVLTNELGAMANKTSRLEGCKTQLDPSSFYLVDLDGDGGREAIGFYTMNNCADGSGNIRVLAVLRQDEAGTWTPLVQAATAVSTQPDRPVIGIDTERGVIILAGEADELGGTAPPQEIEIPPQSMEKNSNLPTGEANASGDPRLTGAAPPQ